MRNIVITVERMPAEAEPHKIVAEMGDIDRPDCRRAEKGAPWNVNFSLGCTASKTIIA